MLHQLPGYLPSLKQVSRFLRQGDQYAHPGTFGGRRIDIQQPVDKIGPLLQVNHAQAAAFFIIGHHFLHVETDPVVDDFQQGHLILLGKEFESHGNQGGQGMLAGIVHCFFGQLEDYILFSQLQMVNNFLVDVNLHVLLVGVPHFIGHGLQVVVGFIGQA